MHFFIPVSDINLFAQENTAFKAEGSIAKGEFTLYKRETTYNNLVFILPGGQSGSGESEKLNTPQPDRERPAPLATLAADSAVETRLPSRRVFRLANHVIIDQSTDLTAGMSLELADDFYISAHIVEEPEVFFPSWDSTERNFRVNFGPNGPISAGSIETSKLVPFVNGLAKISSHISLACRRVEPGQTLFFEKQAFAISLVADCKSPLWGIQRLHTREVPKHYFLLFNNGTTKEPR